jgi:cytochrome c oxidase subunit 1
MPRATNLLRYWIVVVFLLFPILALAGILMRGVQSGRLDALGAWFYPMMTLHGVGMVGLWYVAAMACATDIVTRATGATLAFGRLALVGTVAGVGLLLLSVLGGRFAAGWYFLYPLPMYGNWPAWATVAFLVSLTLLGATWLVWTLDLMRAIATRYRLHETLGWHYLAGRDQPTLPPALLIITVSLICSVAALVAAVVLIVLFLVDIAGGGAADPLLMKNLTFFFGHTLINLALYLGVAAVYDTLPEYAERPWRTNRVVAISWNAVLLIVLIAYFHHLYMDFVQPGALQYIGQVASYASAIPAAIVTLFGALLLVFRARMRWQAAPVLMYVGLAGWAIGGVGALIDSTISANVRLHNTLWVPAHFHTYALAGMAFMVLGYFLHRWPGAAATEVQDGRQRLAVGVMAVGAYGFFLMFYLAGAWSVPRRFANYPAELAHGATFAGFGALFALLFLAGFLAFAGAVLRRWRGTAAGAT